MIDPTEPFCLQATCRVIYDGRAYSVLETGQYLVLHKADGSLQIHGENLIKPLNYQGPKSSLEYTNSTLVSLNKGEKITIEIDEILSYNTLNLSPHQITIKRTERELVLKIIRDWEHYFDEEFEVISTEYITDVGTLDILGIATSGTHYIIEVKRKRMSLKDCSQLQRYRDHFKKFNTVGVLAGPEITANALKYLKSNDMQFLEVGFDA